MRHRTSSTEEEAKAAASLEAAANRHSQRARPDTCPEHSLLDNEDCSTNASDDDDEHDVNVAPAKEAQKAPVVSNTDSLKGSSIPNTDETCDNVSPAGTAEETRDQTSDDVPPVCTAEKDESVSNSDSLTCHNIPPASTETTDQQVLPNADSLASSSNHSMDPPALSVSACASMPELRPDPVGSIADDEIPSSQSALESPPAAAATTSPRLFRRILKSSSSLSPKQPPDTASPPSVRHWFRQQSSLLMEKTQQAYHSSVAATAMAAASVTDSVLSLNRSDHVVPRDHGNDDNDENGPMLVSGALSRDPMEGVLKLDGSPPLLLCQEIYNKIIGNHQTSIVSKEKVLELLQQDVKNHEDEDDDDELEAVLASARSQESDEASLPPPPPPLVVETSQSAAPKGGRLNGDNGSKQAENSADENGTGPLNDAVAVSPDHEVDPGGGVSECKEDEDGNTITSPKASLQQSPRPDPPAANEATSNDDVVPPPATAAADVENSNEQQQPIIGYWAWNHTLRVHRMKMNLAQNSDLAMHVVLAIIVNQVRLERNAVALAV
jgi:hypothetical protein